MGGRLGQQGALLLNQSRSGHLVMGKQGAQMQATALFGNPGQVGNAAQIHNMFRSGKPQLHQRDQAHAPRQHLGFAIGQQIDRFLHRSGSGVIEFLGNHAEPPC